jgi:N,N'-diacetylchitobiose phosphorylase
MRYGHFDLDRDEYVIENVDTPASWINYLGVRDFCTVIDQQGAGYSFYRSAERGRVTRFRPNGPLATPGHWLYIRDADTGAYWSVTKRPAAAPGADYRTRHGLGYTVFECDHDGISASQKVFVPVDEDTELWDVGLTNTSGRPRRLSLFSYVEFSFHTVSIDHQNLQMSLYAAGTSYADGVLEYDFHYEPWTFHFVTASADPAGFDGRREVFLGDYRTEAAPIAVERGRCGDSEGTTGNHCGALQHDVTLEPGETRRLTYLLGYGNRDVGERLRAKYREPAAVDAACAGLRAYWAGKKAQLSVETPSQTLNTLVNTWTLLQMETCVVWSRFASFVEVGGRTGLGYRDTAQDVIGAAHTNPGTVRQRLEELLHGQMAEGYGLHLFDPLLFADAEQPEIPVGVKLPTVVPNAAAGQLHGLEDACSDDHLWLVGAVVEYVKETGDLAFLRVVVPFADSPVILSAATDLPGPSRDPATIYDHLKRAVDFTTAHTGAHGLAQGLRADWNDCLNLGGGETALVSFLHVWAARLLAETAAALGEAADAARYAALAEAVAATAERELWDGGWYRRGYTKDGVVIGSAASPEGKIFLEHMGWAVIAGVASPDHGRRALDAVHDKLASPFGLHLCWPSYTTVDDTIGYVTRVYPGVKENGAIFSHPNAWPIIAETILGRGDRAMEYYEALAPANANDEAGRRRAEPYVYAQFLYGRDHEWYGRAENPWLTGTAGWMYQAATKYILGVRPGFAGLTVDPSIPEAWDGFRVTRRWRGGIYDIDVRNPDHVSCGVAAATLDGRPVELVKDALTGRRSVLLPPVEGDHAVAITLG